MRLDKYLKVSRLIKRRTVANEACDNGLVTVNGKPARASYEVKEGDQITLTVESEHEDWKTATEDLLITELTIHLDSSVEIRTAGEAEEEMEREDPVLPQENDSDPGSGETGGNSGNVVSDDDDDDDGDDDTDDDDGDDDDDDDDGDDDDDD